MAKIFLDFVGLNTFIYEPVGYNVFDTTTEVTSENGTEWYTDIPFGGNVKDYISVSDYEGGDPDTHIWVGSNISNDGSPGFHNPGTRPKRDYYFQGTEGKLIDDGLFTRRAVRVYQNYAGLWEHDIWFEEGGDPEDDQLEHQWPRMRDINQFQNYRFMTAVSPQIKLPSTASVFAALMMKRNGPYGWPVWKQIRVGEQPLFRKQRKSNIFTHAIEPGEQITFKVNGRLNTVRSRYGEVKIYNETPVTSIHKPMELLYGGVDGDQYGLKMSYGNSIHHFNNKELDLYYNLDKCEVPNWESLRKTYGKDDVLDMTDVRLERGTLTTPIGKISSLTYKQNIFPTSLYRFKKFSKQRTSFVFPWKSGSWTGITRGTTAPTSLQTEIAGFYYHPLGAYSPGGLLGLRTTVALFNFKTGSFVAGAQARLDRYVTQSVWPMDVDINDFVNRDPHSNGLARHHGYRNENQLSSDRPDHTSYGVLQNQICRYHRDVVKNDYITASVDPWIRVSPLYYWHHYQCPSQSVVSPNGMRIEGVRPYDYGSNLGDIASASLPCGETHWEANRTRQEIFNSSSTSLFPVGPLKGLGYHESPREPFLNSYEKFSLDIETKFKDYGLIPEFTISKHLDHYITNDSLTSPKGIFEITGGLRNISDSSRKNFYTVFSTSDFLKHFEVIKEQNEGDLEAKAVSLKCKAVLKFVPYDGFYPAQRTVKIAEQFVESYKNSFSIKYKGSSTYEGTEGGIMNIMTPLMAPGVLYNSIKSGVACDYMLVTSSLNAHAIPLAGEDTIAKTVNNTTYGGQAHCGGDTLFAKFGTSAKQDASMMIRIPFRSLVEPEVWLTDKEIPCNVPNFSGNLSSSVIFSGVGDQKYKYMMHNFLATVPRFFLKDGTFTALKSAPSNEAGFGYAIGGKTYGMRVKMFKSMNEGPYPWKTTKGNFFPPQYGRYTATGGEALVYETFTMYSRPSAFGPPYVIGDQASANVGYAHSKYGCNFAFTPPYYYGEAWADIKWTPTESRKYIIKEIIESSSVSYCRFKCGDNNSVDFGSIAPWGQGNPSLVESATNKIAMQLSASLQLYGVGRISNDLQASGQTINTVSDTEEGTHNWIIQPWFETPMLNFNHLSGSGLNGRQWGDAAMATTNWSSSIHVVMPSTGEQAVARGMWHQYGIIENDQSKGIFMQVTDIPEEYDNYLHRVDNSHVKTEESMADLVGFSKNPVRLGELRDSLTVWEAVVAVPFIEFDGERRFFKKDRAEFETTADVSTIVNPLNGTAITHKLPVLTEFSKNMIKVMNKYVFPPNMDFVNNKSVDPFAMYVFEFMHKFDKQDLADIWQNLPPKLESSFQTQKVLLGHRLLANNLLSAKPEIVTDGQGNASFSESPEKQPNPLPENIKWMVFKVKQRAENNWYKQILGEISNKRETIQTTSDFRENTANIMKSDQISTDARIGHKIDGINLTYNWPYDFFSMIELINIEASVSLGPKEDSSTMGTGDPAASGINISANQATAFAQSLESPPVISRAAQYITTMENEE